MSDKDLLIALVLALLVGGQKFDAVEDAHIIMQQLKPKLDAL